MPEAYHSMGLGVYNPVLAVLLWIPVGDNGVGMINSIIRGSIDTIAASYKGGTREWLAQRNPMALRQLDALEAKVDAAALAEDPEATRKACKIWEQTWIFWSGNFRRGL